MYFSEKLKKLFREELFRTIKDRDHYLNGSSKIIINGKRFINFASNDYLGLSNNLEIIEAAKSAIDKYGFGATASRLLSGGIILHKRLEENISNFKGTESALIFNSGYTANSSISVIAEEGDLILSDELNHASIIDGCKLSKAKRIIYRHCDTEMLYCLLKKESGQKKIVVTDSVFSMDGDIAPLKEIYGICKELNNSSEKVILYIDDAHGTGVLGSGKGALNHFGISPEPWIIQMVTFSKALGSYGAAIAASKDVIEYLINFARGFIFSTALPPCVIAATIKALEIIQKDEELVKKLWVNRERLVNGIKTLGYNIHNSASPIIPLEIGTLKDTLRLSQYLMENGIYAPAIRPPTVKTPRIRITVTSAHSEDDLDKLISVLSRFTK
jgi:8-amino-7-oxononanoate synthase